MATVLPSDGAASPVDSAGGASRDRAMGLWEHLMELRARLIRSALVLAAGFVVAAAFSPRIVAFLRAPLDDYNRANPDAPVLVIALDPAAGFSALISVGLFGALGLAAPWIGWELWRFVKPALGGRAPIGVGRFAAAVGVLFWAGAAAGYFLASRATLAFFFSLNAAFGIAPTTGLGEYIGMMVALMTGFGLGFELPAAMMLLARLGLVSSGFYRARRRYAIVAAFVAGAVLTPPDVPSQAIMAGCLLALYELGIRLAAAAERRGDLHAPVPASTGGR